MGASRCGDLGKLFREAQCVRLTHMVHDLAVRYVIDHESRHPHPLPGRRDALKFSAVGALPGHANDDGVPRGIGNLLLDRELKVGEGSPKPQDVLLEAHTGDVLV